MSSDKQDEYKVKLDVFEGPLDLLLYLIKREEIDIYDIPIETITTQYMQYLDMMCLLDLNIAGEFLVMASTLLMIKSRMLLPVEVRGDEEDEQEEDDPRWDLVKQLVEYKKFKDAAHHLHHLEVDREDVFPREEEGVTFGPDPDAVLRDVGIFDLIAAFNEALSRVKKEELREIFAHEYTVAEKVDSLVNELKKRERISLTKLFSGMHLRNEMICTFLAVLELIKLNQIQAKQEAQFGEIVIMRIEDV